MQPQPKLSGPLAAVMLSGQQPKSVFSQEHPSACGPDAEYIMSGQQPNSDSMQQPSSLKPCAGTLFFKLDVATK